MGLALVRVDPPWVRGPLGLMWVPLGRSMLLPKLLRTGLMCKLGLALVRADLPWVRGPLGLVRVPLGRSMLLPRI